MVSDSIKIAKDIFFDDLSIFAASRRVILELQQIWIKDREKKKKKCYYFNQNFVIEFFSIIYA